MLQSLEPNKTRQSELRYWEKHFNAWQASGLSQPKYCEKANINYNSFCYWRTCLKKEDLKPSPKQPSSFKQVTIKSLPNAENEFPTSCAIQVYLPNKVKIEIPPQISLKELSSIFQALGGEA